MLRGRSKTCLKRGAVLKLHVQGKATQSLKRNGADGGSSGEAGAGRAGCACAEAHAGVCEPEAGGREGGTALKKWDLICF